MIRAFVAALAALAALGAAAEPVAKRPMTFEDLWAMTRVGGPAVSPDGKWAVFAATVWSMDDNKSNSDLWIVPTDGSAPPRDAMIAQTEALYQELLKQKQPA